MDWKLELVVLPVSDVDRAKAFYAEKVGFNVDHDTRVSDEMRVVQLTPPGSACSIAIGTGLSDEMPPGSVQGLQLVVSDIEAARAVEMFRLLGGGVAGDLAGLPNSRLAVLPGTTHAGLVERSDLLVSMVGEFLDAPMPEA